MKIYTKDQIKEFLYESVNWEVNRELKLKIDKHPDATVYRLYMLTGSRKGYADILYSKGGKHFVSVFATVKIVEWAWLRRQEKALEAKTKKSLSEIHAELF